MSKNKTRPNTNSVGAFLDTIENPIKRKDCNTLLDLFKEITNHPPMMWGGSIIGFGSYHYVYDSGREGDMFLTGFSPRKQNISIYIMAGFKRYGELMETLGPHKTGKSCLYVKRLADVNADVLQSLIQLSYNHMNEKYNLKTN
ncbi:DUF1801 domain-containing protein [Spongiimicrobium salis]|uniref:DUF1801 domain-containing protein n=1 Tax=Spongiimicrobium salis TaxID=1667022 RepID=UPI00374D3EEB